MNREPNQEIVNDTAKLMMHRLVARYLAHDPSLINRARISHRRNSARFPDRTFVREWDELLALPPDRLRGKLTSRHPDMRRLRLSSPFVVAEGVDFTDPLLRLRIRRAAKRVAERGLAMDRFVFDTTA